MGSPKLASRPRVPWRWPLALAGVLSLALALGWWVLPRVSGELNRRVTIALASALEGSDQPVSIGKVALAFPPGIRVEPVQVELDDEGSVFAPDVTIGVDVSSALRDYTHPERAVRRVEADNVVIRSTAQISDAHQPEGSLAQEDGASAPVSIASSLQRAREAILGALAWVRENQASIEWMRPGDALSWSLGGVWEEVLTGGERVQGGTRWSTQGELRRAADGSLVAEGTITFGALRASFLGSVGSDRLELRRLAAEHEGLKLAAQGTAGLSSPSGDLILDVSGDVQGARTGQVPEWKVSFSTAGSWTEQGLPPLRVTVHALGSAAPASPERLWPDHLVGASGAFTALLDDRTVQIRDGRLTKGHARGRFSGTVSEGWPFQTRIAVELTGLVPHEDVPWWTGHEVPSVDARATVSGSADGPWTVAAQVQAPAGRLLGLAAGGLSASVHVDLGAGRVEVKPVTAAVGSGVLTLGAVAEWPSGGAPSIDVEIPEGSLPSSMVLDLSGSLESITSTETATAIASLFGSDAPGRPEGTQPQGEVTGRFDMRLAWPTDGSKGGLCVVTARFDGADGSIDASYEGPDTYTVSADLLDLGGRALRPWLSGVQGHARLDATLQQSQLRGQARVEELTVAGQRLGTLVVPFKADLAARAWQVDEARLEGGAVVGSATARLDLAQWMGQARLQLAQGEGLAPGAAATGDVTIQPDGLRLDRARIDVKGVEVASASGMLPIEWPGRPPSNGGIQVEVRVTRFPLEFFDEFVPAWEVRGGRLTGQLAVTGRLDAPAAQGVLRVQADQVRPRDGTMTSLDDVRLEINIIGGQLQIVAAEARPQGGGTLNLSGAAHLASIWPLVLDPVDLRLRATNATISGRPVDALELSGTYHGELRFAGAFGPDRWPALSGAVQVRGGRVLIWGAGGWLAGGAAGDGTLPGGRMGVQPAPSLPGPRGSPGTEGRPAVSPGVPLDVTIEATDPVQLDVPAIGGSGLAEGTLLLTGTTASPALEGQIRLSQARLRYFGREFRVDAGTLTFSRARGVFPEVDLEASTSTPDGPVQVEIRGDASDVSRLKLSSQPAMTREELLALLLPPRQPSPGDPWVERVNEQLAAWAMDPLERAAREALGLDELWIVPSTSDRGGVWLSLGKYFAPSRVYVRYGRSLLGSGPSQEFDLSFRLTPQLTWRAIWSDQGGEGSWQLGLRWQWSF